MQTFFMAGCAVTYQNNHRATPGVIENNTRRIENDCKLFMSGVVGWRVWVCVFVCACVRVCGVCVCDERNNLAHRHLGGGRGMTVIGLHWTTSLQLVLARGISNKEYT